MNLYTAAVEECRKYVIELQKKENKNKTDFDSPIVFAMKHQRLSIVKMLAESSGVDFNLETDDGNDSVPHLILATRDLNFLTLMKVE